MQQHRRIPSHPAGFQPRQATRLPVFCLLALVVASEYKFRLRDQDQSISGAPDVFVLLEIAIYAIVACLLFRRFRPAPRLTTAHWVTAACYGYVAVLALSAMYSPYFEMAVVRACQMCVILAVTRSLARHADRTAMHYLAHCYAVLVAGSVVFGVVVPFPRRESQAERFTWLYLHPVTAGQFLAIAVVVLAAYVIGQGTGRPGPQWHIASYLGLLAVCAAGLIATNTRGAALGAIIGSVVALWLRWRGTRRLEITAYLAIGALAISLAATQAILAFFTRGHSMTRIGTLNARTELWGYAMRAFTDRPLYGHGLSATRGLFLDEMGLGGGHNAVINLLVNTGVLGLAAWSAVVIGIFVNVAAANRLRPEPRIDRTIIVSVMLALLSNSVFTQALGAPSNVACVWLLALAAWSVMLRSSDRTVPAPLKGTR